jgi:hypothetical protein
MKLNARLQNMVFKSAVAATQDKSNCEYNFGIARGVALAVNAFQEHFSRKPSAE